MMERIEQYMRWASSLGFLRSQLLVVYLPLAAFVAMFFGVWISVRALT